MKQLKRPPKRRSDAARALAEGQYRQKVVASAKAYGKKERQKERVLVGRALRGEPGRAAA